MQLYLGCYLKYGSDPYPFIR